MRLSATTFKGSSPGAEANGTVIPYNFAFYLKTDANVFKAAMTKLPEAEAALGLACCGAAGGPTSPRLVAHGTGAGLGRARCST